LEFFFVSLGGAIVGKSDSVGPFRRQALPSASAETSPVSFSHAELTNRKRRARFSTKSGAAFSSNSTGHRNRGFGSSGIPLLYAMK
jgi:hypothetical protein